MKYAFKVTRNVQSGKVLVSGLSLVPDDTEPYVEVKKDRTQARTEMVEVLHVYENKEDARSCRSWEVAASHFHRYTQRHLADIIRADVARAAELGISQEQLNRWLGRGDRYFAQAGATGHTEPRKTAKLHIFMGLLEKLIARANFNLSDDMRPYDRKK